MGASRQIISIGGGGFGRNPGVGIIEQYILDQTKKRKPKISVFNPPYTTLQIGGISGGIARNVIADKCKVDWELRPVVKDDGVFVNNEIDKFVKTELLPEMQKVYPKSEIRKEVIGEIIGFDREKNSEACELVSSITGDNSREVVSFGTEAGLFQEVTGHFSRILQVSHR